VASAAGTATYPNIIGCHQHRFLPGNFAHEGLAEVWNTRFQCPVIASATGAPETSFATSDINDLSHR
jgi:hypothetical protein